MRGAIALVAVLVTASVASAHGLLVTLEIRAEKVHVEVFYDDDTPAETAKLAVTDAEGKTVAEGTADDRGFWDFDVPTAGEYVLIAKATGHRAKKSFTIGGAAPAAEPSREQLTGVPWERIAIGFVVIGLITAVSWHLRRK